MPRFLPCAVAAIAFVAPAARADWVRDLQTNAVEEKACAAAHWGPEATRYSTWTHHSNRMIPVYTYGTRGAGEGIDLASYTGDRSVYRDASRVRRLYHGVAEDTLNPNADYMDQTNVCDMQVAALEAGRKHIFLIVFDGMDWQTTWAASIWNRQEVAYREGRGVGTHFQEYQANGTSQFGWMVTSPYRDGAQLDVDNQAVRNPGGGLAGGYSARVAGAYPWSTPTTAEYLIAGPADALVRHAYTDSAASATSMCCGIKTYNDAIGVGPTGEHAVSVAHRAQASGYLVGVVSSVPFCHATPAAAYARNVLRDDFQDLSRDLLGLPSISHPDQALPGMDVVIGGGHGVEDLRDKSQGSNFVPGNTFMTLADLRAIDADRGGKYVVAQRTPGVRGGSGLAAAASRAASEGKRLFGFYGVTQACGDKVGHLPYASADGDYKPAPSIDGAPIEYTPADITENPTLAEMTSAALTVLSAGDKGIWLMVEAGDVDWANHSNNLDASIGAVNSGDAAVRVVTDWVEKHSNWQESLLIVTADHGHYLVIDDPTALIEKQEPSAK